MKKSEGYRRSEDGDNEYPGNGVEKISKMIEELMEDHLREFNEKRSLKKPLIYGMSMKIENGKKHIHEFGNLKNGTMEEREPLVDIIEDKETITVLAELPGVSKEDISLDLENENELTINVNGKNHKYKKTLTLPNKADESGIKAVCNNGILEIIFKRKNEAPKRIRPS